MNEKQQFADLARLVKFLQQHPAGSDMRRVLANALPNADETLAWLDRQARRAGFFTFAALSSRHLSQS